MSRVIMLAGRCGRHHDKECETCEAASDCTNAEILNLHDEIARLQEALEPFVTGYEHTVTFLRTRERMHSAGQELYAEDVARARAALRTDQTEKPS